MLGDPAIAGRFVPRAVFLPDVSLVDVLLVDVLMLLKLLLSEPEADSDLREGCVTMPATTNLSAVVRLFGEVDVLLF